MRHALCEVLYVLGLAPNGKKGEPGKKSKVRPGNAVNAKPRILYKVRAAMACFLSREMGILMAEIARRLGIGASAVAMAIGRKNS